MPTAMLLGFGIGMLLFRPKAIDTEQGAIGMAATPLARSTHSAKVFQPMPSSQQHFLQPLTRVQMPMSQSVVNANFARGPRGGYTKAVPEVGEIAGAGKLFEFDATLPTMIGLLTGLTVFLDKTLFGPVGKHIAERDESIRKRVASVKGNTEEVAALKAQAEQIVKDAQRASKAAEIAAKEKRTKEYEAAISAAKVKLEAAQLAAKKNLAEEIKKIEASSEAESTALADQIVKTLVPQ